MILRVEVAEGDREQAVALHEVVAEERVAEGMAGVDGASGTVAMIDALAHRRDVDLGRALLAPVVSVVPQATIGARTPRAASSLDR